MGRGKKRSALSDVYAHINLSVGIFSSAVDIKESGEKYV